MKPCSLRDRRSFLAAVAATPIVLAGCLGDDDGHRLDSDDFEDAYLHLVAEGVARTDLELLELYRDDEGWIHVELQFDGALAEHIRLPEEIEVPTPIRPELRENFLEPPEAEVILEWYTDAVADGEDGEGIELLYTDDECTGTTNLPRPRIDWYLDDQLDWVSVLGELEFRYSVEC